MNDVFVSYINIECYVDRNEHMVSQLRKMGTVGCRVNAMGPRGAAMPTIIGSDRRYGLKGELNTLTSTHNNDTRMSELGCIASHIEAIRLFTESGKEYGLILEDDVEIQNWIDIREIHRSAPDDAELISLFTCPRNKEAIHTLRCNNNKGCVFTEWEPPFFSAVAYTLTRKNALKLLAKCTRDNTILIFNSIPQSDMFLYSSVKTYVISSNMVTINFEKSFPSCIHTEHDVPNSIHAKIQRENKPHQVFEKFMKRKNIFFSNIGDETPLNNLLAKYSFGNNFYFVLYYYGDSDERFDNICTCFSGDHVVIRQKGCKFQNLLHFLDTCEEFDNIFVVDEQISINTSNIQTLFDLMKSGVSVDVCSPAIAHDGKSIPPPPHQKFILRPVSFIDATCPLFSYTAVNKLMASYRNTCSELPILTTANEPFFICDGIVVNTPGSVLTESSCQKYNFLSPEIHYEADICDSTKFVKIGNFTEEAIQVMFLNDGWRYMKNDVITLDGYNIGPTGTSWERVDRILFPCQIILGPCIMSIKTFRLMKKQGSSPISISLHNLHKTIRTLALCQDGDSHIALSPKQFIHALTNKPSVTIVTPTYKRAEFLPKTRQGVEQQNYTGEIEWIILDDSPEINPMFEDLDGTHIKKNIRVKYVHIPFWVNIGIKRNIINRLSKGSIIICFDDDDIQHPERVKHTVTKLKQHKVPIAGSSITLLLFRSEGVVTEVNDKTYTVDTNDHYSTIHKQRYGSYKKLGDTHTEEVPNIYKCGGIKGNGMGKYHTVGSSMAYTLEYSLTATFGTNGIYAEEANFTKKSTVPMVQLDPYKVILLYCHKHNTYDKTKWIANSSFPLWSCKIDQEGINLEILINAKEPDKSSITAMPTPTDSAAKVLTCTYVSLNGKHSLKSEAITINFEVIQKRQVVNFEIISKKRCKVIEKLYIKTLIQKLNNTKLKDFTNNKVLLKTFNNL